MGIENRQHPRYSEIGRATAEDICAIAGILDDISAAGCKIHYTFPVVVDLETEYEVKITPLHITDQKPLKLICLPQWVKEIDGNTFIGFKIEYSPDAARLTEFVETLEKLNSENDFPDII